jgi:phage shock protein A
MALFKKESAAQPGSGPAAYGIGQAILLMRSLPVDQNVELVVRVIRQTLESMNVQLPEIIDDALAKETALQGRMERLDLEIEAYAEQIEVRRQEITQLQAELRETSTVKDRLLLAQKQTVAPPPLPHPAPRAAPELRDAAE